jgi:hypothetical protein
MNRAPELVQPVDAVELIDDPGSFAARNASTSSLLREAGWTPSTPSGPTRTRSFRATFDRTTRYSIAEPDLMLRCRSHGLILFHRPGPARRPPALPLSAKPGGGRRVR